MLEEGTLKSLNMAVRPCTRLSPSDMITMCPPGNGRVYHNGYQMA